MTDTSGPAFPIGGLFTLYQGMTRRQLLAAMAMQGMLANNSASRLFATQENRAHEAYKQADAMLNYEQEEK